MSWVAQVITGVWMVVLFVVLFALALKMEREARHEAVER